MAAWNMTTPILKTDDDVQFYALRNAADAQSFADLNREWLKEFFYVEAEDERILSNPVATIIEPGGHIFLARTAEGTVGACALFPIPGGDFEFAKMAVSPRAQGRGIGRNLLLFALDQARTLGAKIVLICTSSTLGAANHLYKSVGFVPSTDPRHHAYARADVYLELTL